MLGFAPDRIAVYHTQLSPDTTNPDWVSTDAVSLYAAIRSLNVGQALEANAEGRFNRRVTHTMHVEYAQEVVPNALVRRHDDNTCYWVLSVRESDLRRFGKPDHLLVELSLAEPGMPLPDVPTSDRRYR